MAQPTVLLVDDELHVTAVLGDRLKQEGYLVLSASDGAEGLRLAFEHLPDLVCTDMQMPRMSGIELATKLREDPRTADTPVVMLSARGYLAPAEDLARTRVIEQVPKPFSPKKLAKLIASILENAESGSAPVTPDRREAA